MNIRKIVLKTLSISFTILVLLLAVFALYQIGLHSYQYGYRVFTEPPVSSGRGRDRTVRITKSMSPSDVGQLLENKGLIRDKWLFVLQMRLCEYNSRLLAGRYTLNTSMTAQEMMQVMSGEDIEESAEEES